MSGTIRDFVVIADNWVEEPFEQLNAGTGQEGSSHAEDGKKDELQTNNHNFKMPDEIGILAIRNAVVYPGTVAPLAVGREKSKALLAATKPNETVIGILTQRSADTEKPGFSDLYKIGTAATVLKILRAPQGSMSVFVHGIVRFEVIEPISTEPYLKAKVRLLKSETKMTKRIAALMVSVKQTANRVISLSPNVPEEIASLLEEIEDPSALADYLAANVSLRTDERQKLLEELDATKRLEHISLALARQLEVLELSHKIQGRVQESVEKNQREYFLQEQLKAIQSELGKEDSRTEEIKEITEKIKKAKMPERMEAEAMRELDRLSKMMPASPEYSVIRTYLDFACELPWSAATQDNIDIRKAEGILNRDHYNLKKIKKRILEFLAVRKLNPTGKSPILCFIGPPGVGKTSLGKSIARAMGRKFIRISLGGIRDEADIRGHRRTYIGALPGRVLQELRKSGTKNPVFMLDELDKIGADFRGDPASALLEVLDPEQNYSFTDHYLDQPFDLSNVMFIGTANYAEPIPPALHDRMEIIELPGYTETEKLNIARKYLVPRQLAEHGLKKQTLNIKDEAIASMIRNYTREAGVRSLERNIASVCRAVATEIAKNKKRKSVIDAKDLAKILGPTQYESELALRAGIPGVATALAYTPVGGEIMFIESASMPGKGVLQLTGHIGDVMKESAQAAFSIVKSTAEKMGLDGKQFGKYDYHIHVPSGAVPKDGPSAGVAMFTSLASMLLHKPVKPDVAMTGEITLRGLVLPIGGLKEKILAAKQAGIKTVILPSRNKKDLPEVPKEAKKGLTFKFVKNTNEVLKFALNRD
jgi:ATP-dependent Lon protease